MLLIVTVAKSQPIQGDNLVAINDTEVYFIATAITPLGNYWEVTGGTVISTTANNSTNEFTATIKWNIAGSQTITFSSFGGSLATMNVTVGSLPAKPPTPTSTSNTCGANVLTRNGSIPTGETWYWQNSVNGTSQLLGSSENYIVAQTGTYYIRARNNLGWGSSSSGIQVTVNELPEAPDVPSISTNTCGLSLIHI